ncbi:MAG: hypothetical protein ACI9TK_000188 [Flavobacteriaceae bacterium]|jgi:hypothetical protein
MLLQNKNIQRHFFQCLEIRYSITQDLLRFLLISKAASI